MDGGFPLQHDSASLFRELEVHSDRHCFLQFADFPSASHPKALTGWGDLTFLQ